MQMTAAKTAGAALHERLDWEAIDWPKVEASVRRLQERIVKAVKLGKWGRVQALQRLLTRSHSGKLLAVRRVTQNSGSKTPGVDRITWRNRRSKEDAVMSLEHRGYRPLPLRRIYIPKSNSDKMRPLGIPTMRDRAMQALHLLALEPIAETLADPNSYGFRKGRSCADAIEQCHKLLAGARDRWILEGDIKSCFDRIGHEWLLAHIPMERAILRKWLRSGYMEKDAFHATSQGTPQGGIISPTLANMTLDGLETRLRKEFPTEGPGCGQGRKAYMHLVRYADDFVVTGSTRELLETRVRPLVQEFLHERGLELSLEKTSITHVADGFDFLGQSVRAYGRKTLVTPDKKRVKTFLDNIRSLVKRNPQTPADKLIAMLNPKIRGWANYHRHVCCNDTFRHVDTAIFRCLWQWARRRHRYPHKSRHWVADRYFATLGNRSWRFFGDEQPKGAKPVRHWLCLAARTPFVRHIKVRADANPYDAAWNEYFQLRSAPGAKTAGVKPATTA
jgi:RNA-directed DNA polymerase